MIKIHFVYQKNVYWKQNNKLSTIYVVTHSRLISHSSSLLAHKLNKKVSVSISCIIFLLQNTLFPYGITLYMNKIKFYVYVGGEGGALLERGVNQEVGDIVGEGSCWYIMQ